MLSEKRNLTGQALASAVVVSRITINSWKRGDTHPSPANLEKLAQALKVDRSVLLTPDSRLSDNFLRRIMRKFEDNFEQEAPDIDLKTYLAVRRALGLDIIPTQKVEVDVLDKAHEPTDADEQFGNLKDDISKSQAKTDSKSDSS